MEIRNPDYIVLQDAAEPPDRLPYGVRMIGSQLEAHETTGEGIRVAILDTGAPQHPDIKLAGMYDATGGSQPYDRRGHGTHVAGTIAANGKIVGVAPGVSLFAVKVFQDSGGTKPEWLISGLRWCRDNRIDVVNMSLGGPQAMGPAMETELKACVAAGIIISCSAGNFGKDYGVLYPAQYPECIAVAAVDIEKGHADWSAYGPQLDVAAAGVQVWSTWLGGRYTELNGTSMAAPHITGAVAILQAKAIIREGKKDSPEFMRLMLRRYAEDLGEPGPDHKYGCGVFSFGRFGVADRVPSRLLLEIGKTQYVKNGMAAQSDVAPEIKQGRTLVPLRLVAEGLGGKVDWFPPDGTHKGKVAIEL